MTTKRIKMAALQKSIDKKNAILNATLTLVNDGGFRATSMSKIAKIAGVSPATIYLYFTNKQDLINQLYLSLKKDFCDHAFRNYPSENQSIKDGFKRIWFNMVEYKLNQTKKACFLSQCDNTPIIDKTTQQQGILLLQPLVDLWDQGKKQNIIKPISSYLLYGFTIYPIAFLITAQKKEDYILKDTCINGAFQVAWDSIKQNYND